jgi:hypothetical protein
MAGGFIEPALVQTFADVDRREQVGLRRRLLLLDRCVEVFFDRSLHVVNLHDFGLDLLLGLLLREHRLHHAFGKCRRDGLRGGH